MNKGIWGALSLAMYFALQVPSQSREHSLNTIILMPLYSFKKSQYIGSSKYSKKILKNISIFLTQQKRL